VATAVAVAVSVCACACVCVSVSYITYYIYIYIETRNKRIGTLDGEDSKLAILLYCCFTALRVQEYLLYWYKRQINVYCKQRIETLDGEDSKRFYLQYTFPPSCVGECGRVGAIGRREIGHGIMQCGLVGGWVGG
jgi:hypothetical protein